MTKMVKLHGGAEVTIDEFITWNKLKQHYAVNGHPHKGRKLSKETRVKMSATKLKAGRPPWNKGKKMTEEYKNRLKTLGKKAGRPKGSKDGSHVKSLRGRPVGCIGRRGRTSTPIMTPNGLYPGKKYVAEQAKVHITTIDYWMMKWPEHYYYVVN